MTHIDAFRDKRLGKELARLIELKATRPMTLMEVCGTHTMAIARHGIKGLLPPNIKIVSGPGCPVCVTPQSLIDSFIELGKQSGMILATFGDMMRVPGSWSSLELERASGLDVRVVYSPLDSVKIARENPGKKVVFFGIGFETTAPAVALAVLEARSMGLENFFILSAHKLIPPALEFLASDSETNIEGFLCPGHVSAIIGSLAYSRITRDYGIPCVIAGFEPLDILQGILMLVSQVEEGRAEIETQYSRAVSQTGNLEALRCLDSVFQVTDAEWRGLGVIPQSGLEFKSEFSKFDASRLVPERSFELRPNVRCVCGRILKGLLSPTDCPVFGSECTPTTPLGPCMVSSEGACSAEYRYGRLRGGSVDVDMLC
ncbi:MAG: hydrogenase formation protein HypD [Armatimonadetes bacterium]|nr:hydrogenase formation protein HypD [Armatimonadota bacterium]